MNGSGDLLVVSLPRAAAPASAEARARLLASLAAVAEERLLLATCERVELYLAGARGGLPRFAELRSGAAAARHLFRVAAGLESKLRGEPQIQGQVRAAFLEARAHRALGPLLDALSRGALHAGKRVRAETGLGRAPTLVTLTLARLAEQLSGLRRRTVLVAGTGALGKELALALRASGVGRLLVSSHSPARAAELAARCGAAVLAPGAPQAVDAVVACSNGRIRLDGIVAREGARLALLDLGVPPNLDAAAAARGSLTRLAELTPDATAAVAPAALRAAESIVDDELRRFLRWRAARRRHALLGRGEAA